MTMFRVVTLVDEKHLGAVVVALKGLKCNSIDFAVVTERPKVEQRSGRKTIDHWMRIVPPLIRSGTKVKDIIAQTGISPSMYHMVKKKMKGKRRG